MTTDSNTKRDFHTAMAAKTLSANFTAADLCCAGQTWQRTRIWNEPLQGETWAALESLCQSILEPLGAKFGPLVITYGFASAELFRHIPSGTAMRLDQHASCELGRNGKPICPRLGAAVDFSIPLQSSRAVAVWIAENLPFDRMYFYGDERPLHVSIGPDCKRALVEMVPLENGHHMPRNRKLHWLTET